MIVCRLLSTAALTLTLSAGLLSIATVPAAENAAKRMNISPTDWPWWRGPSRDGHAAAEPPVSWSEEESIVWKAAVPGRGHASPVVLGTHVYLASADEENEIQWVLAYDRNTGRELWRTVVHEGKFVKKGNRKSSQASGSVACDGERIFANFVNDGAVQATALSPAGKILWQKQVAKFDMHQGFGSSPCIWEQLVIFSADSRAGGAIVALERSTGEEVWRQRRPKKPNYTSPIVLRVAGRDQLIVAGCDLVSSYDPLSGEKLWEVKESTTECVGTIVTDGERVFCSGGFPKNHTMAIAGDGSGAVAWQNNSRVYVPTMLVVGKHLYTVTDNGIAICYKSDTGEEVWKGRATGKFSASPTLADGKLFTTSESGVTSIIKATPDRFTLVGENRLGDEAFASPVICGDRIYLRTAELKEGARQEWLYCVGK